MSKGVARKHYTGEFKQNAIETMHSEKLTYRETARRFEVSDPRIVQNWERIYFELGAEALFVEHRGRACAASGTQKGRKPVLKKPAENDLVSELQRLRAENDYLKALRALALKSKIQER